MGINPIHRISGPCNSHISKEKFKGFVKAMRQFSLYVNQEYIFYGNYNLQSGYKAAENFMMLPDPPTAVVGANDILALGGMKYFLQKKMHIPDDIAVIGFDNISLSSMYEPPLSTISLPIALMGEEAVHLFLSMAENPCANTMQVLLETRLIVRNSTCKTPDSVQPGDN